MTTPHQPPTPPVDPNAPFDHPSDARWFDTLTGHTTSAAPNDPAQAEALQLRAALDHLDARALLQAPPQPTAQAQNENAPLHRLLDTLRAEGLLPREPAVPTATAVPAPPSVAPTSGRRHGAASSGWPWWPAFGVASVVAVGLWLAAKPGALPWTTPETIYPEPPTLRSDTPAAPLQQQHPQPQQAAEALAQALRSTGLQALLYQNRSTFIVLVEVPTAPSAEQAATLQAQGLGGRTGSLRVEISAPS